MRIYQNLSIVDENSLRVGTIGLPFRIETALVKKVYGKRDTLSLGLKETAQRGYVCQYGLIGEVITKDFMSRMGVSKIEELVGKEVFGFVHEDSPVLLGLTPKS